MARPVTLNVANFTGKNLILVSQDIEHGKLTLDPPSEIRQIGGWAAATHDGAMIGPKGTITYKAEDDSFSVVFFWNHPYGSATSSYRVTPHPKQAINSSISGSFEGHSQNITYNLLPA